MTWSIRAFSWCQICVSVREGLKYYFAKFFCEGDGGGVCQLIPQKIFRKKQVFLVQKFPKGGMGWEGGFQAEKSAKKYLTLSLITIAV